MIIKRLDKYTPEIANDIQALLLQLSERAKTHDKVPKKWFEDLINSPYHDMIIAVEDGKIVGMATVSINMGPFVLKNVYLEDFVADSSVRGKGVGLMIWEEVEKWGKEKGCEHIEFTCGHKRLAAQEFYKKHGAEIYDTNFFRKQL